MCPEPQLLSIYMDEELPSPWKEKMENHLSECSVCKSKLENFKRYQNLLKKDNAVQRTIVEKNIVKFPSSDSETNADEQKSEQEYMDAAKDRIWRRLSSRQRIKSNIRIWNKRLSIPLPAAAAAAAAIVIVFIAAMWFNSGQVNNSGYAYQQPERANFYLTAEEDIPGIMPASNINDVLQYLSSDGTDVIILRLPESRNFYRTGEPEIIRAADYQRNRSSNNETPRRRR